MGIVLNCSFLPFSFVEPWNTFMFVLNKTTLLILKLPASHVSGFLFFWQQISICKLLIHKQEENSFAVNLPCHLNSTLYFYQRNHQFHMYIMIPGKITAKVGGSQHQTRETFASCCFLEELTEQVTCFVLLDSCSAFPAGFMFSLCFCRPKLAFLRSSVEFRYISMRAHKMS